MKILITGASGFVGSELIPKLLHLNHDLILVSRQVQRLKDKYGTSCHYITWDCLSGPAPKEAVESVDAIINLMGEGVADKRWTQKQKQKIYDSRVLGTTHLVNAVIKYAKNLKIFVSSSAIGFYDHKDPGEKDESSKNGTGFLAKLCNDWEHSLEPLPNTVRCVCIRIGIVLGDGSALAKMKLPFSLGVGGKLGSGNQIMNWIHIEDLVSIFTYALNNIKMSGVVNAVSPAPVTNHTFTKTLGSVLKRPTIFSVPAFILKIALADFSDELLEGQKVIPKRLKELEFNFSYTHLRRALEHALNI